MAIKRKFIEVKIPLTKDTIEVLGPVETLKNKTIKIDLTRRLKGKATEAILSIIAEEEKLLAYPKKISLMKSYLRRIMRKNASYVEDSFEIQCKDITAKIKPFLITRKKVSRAIRNNLRETAKGFLINYIKDKYYLEICENIYKGELQKQMLPKLKKIYPLSLCEIRTIETKNINKANKGVEEKVEEETKEEEKVEEETKEEETSKKTKK